MRKCYLLLLFLCFGCQSRNENVFHIGMAANGVTISGLDTLIANDIARDTSNSFGNLFAVYRLPADTDLKDEQPVQPGKYQLVHGAVLFTPDTTFVTGETYFVRCFGYSTGNTIWDFLSRRKSVRGIKHNDLIFKP